MPDIYDVELVDMTAIANRLDLPVTQVRGWRGRASRSDFPTPVVDLNIGPVWDMEDVYRWWRHRTRALADIILRDSEEEGLIKLECGCYIELDERSCSCGTLSPLIHPSTA